MEATQALLFREYADGTLYPYTNSWEYVREQWKRWEADPANSDRGTIFNYWFGTLRDGVIVDTKDDLNNRDILMFHIHAGDNIFFDNLH